MNIDRLISMTSPTSPNSPASSSTHKSVAETPNSAVDQPSGEKTELEVKTQNESSSPKLNQTSQPKNIQLVRFTPTNNNWQRNSSGSLPATPVRQKERPKTSLARSQSLKSADPGSILPNPAENSSETGEINKETTSDRLLGLLRSKNTSGHFHNVTMNKDDMVVAPQSYLSSNRDFISSNNTARVRSLSTKQEEAGIYVNKLGLSNSKSLQSLKLQKNETAATRGFQNSSFSSSVKDLLLKRKMNKKKALNDSNWNSTKKLPLEERGDTDEASEPDTKKTSGRDTVPSHADNSLENQSSHGESSKSNFDGESTELSLQGPQIDNQQARQPGVNISPHAMTSARNMKVSIKEDNSFKVADVKNGKTGQNKLTKGTTRINVVEETEEPPHKDDTVKLKSVRNQTQKPDSTADSLTTNRPQRNLGSPVNDKHNYQAFENNQKNHSNDSVSQQPIIVQSMNNLPKRPEGPAFPSKREKSMMLKSLKEKWDEALKSEDPNSENRIEELAKLFGDAQKNQQGAKPSSSHSVDILLEGDHHEFTKGKHLTEEHVSEFDGHRPTLVLPRDMEKLADEEQSNRLTDVLLEEQTSNSDDGLLAKRSFPEFSDVASNVPETKKLSHAALITPPPFDERTNIPSEKISISNPLDTNTARFNKLKLSHPINNTILAPNSVRRPLLPKASDPEAERRKFNRAFPSSVLNKLEGKRRYNRETIKDLVQTGVTRHRAFSDNPAVSVTNDVCSANNYEISHAYYYQQLQRRGKLEYLTLDNTLNTSIADVDQMMEDSQKLGNIDQTMMLKSTMSSPEKQGAKSDIEGLSKESWMKEWRSKLRECTIYFDTPVVPKSVISENQAQHLKKVFEVDFGATLADALTEHVDLMIIDDNYRGIDDGVPFSQTVTNAIPGVKSDRKLRVWNQAKAWQFVRNLGTTIRPFTVSLSNEYQKNNGLGVAGRPEQEGGQHIEKKEMPSDIGEQKMTQKETAQKEVAGKEAAEKEAVEKEVTEKEVTEKEAAEKEAAEKEAAEKKVDQREGSLLEGVVLQSAAENIVSVSGREKIQAELRESQISSKSDEDKANKAPNFVSLTHQSRVGSVTDFREEESSDVDESLADDVSYLVNLLQNASILMDTKEKELQTARRIMLQLSQEVMQKELGITSLQGQLKSAQNEVQEYKTILQDYKAVLTEKDIEVSELKHKMQARKRNKRSNSNDHMDHPHSEKIRRKDREGV